MSLWSDAESAVSPTANDVDIAHVIGPATVPRADERKANVVQDTVDDFRDGIRNVDNEQGITEDLGTRVIDGTYVILERYLNHLERSCF